MSSAKRLVLSLRGGRRSGDSGSGGAAAGGGSASSSTRLVLDPLAPGALPASSSSTAAIAASGTAHRHAASVSAHELDEIAVVSAAAEPCFIKYGSGPLGAAANGPRLFPGLAAGASAARPRSGGGGSGGGAERLAASASPLAAKSSCESIILRPTPGYKSVSRQSLLDIVSCKFGVGRGRPTSTQRFFASGDSLATAYVNRAAAVSSTASEVDLSRGVARRRDLRGRLKLPPSVAVATSSTPRGPAARSRRSGPLSPAGGGEGGGNRSGGYYPRFAGGAPNWSFVFDPAGRLCYYWSMVVSLAFLYNFWVIIYRFAFQEINGETLVVWFCLDYLADFLYLADIVFHFRTGYLEDGVLQTDATKLRQHYMNSTTFYIDCLCLLPLDFLYLSIGYNSMLRSFRLVKIYRFWAFMDRTERHTNYPNLFRSTSLIHYLLVIFHWNGCLYHIIHKNDGFGSRNWVFPEAADAAAVDVVRQYLQSYYWCTLALTTIGDLPRPRSKGEYLFVIAQLLFGLLLFATVLGHVANIVTSVSAARKEFQAKLDGVKTYMRMRRVPADLQLKVIKWFDYLWLTQKCSDEEKAVSCLPDKLKAEIAINVHLDTLKRVEIFQNTEAGFLCELVLRLRPVLFSPGDYICRKGEVGKEMYIVNRGRLQVVADNGKTVLATLKAGSYFGEISILNMGTAGNRRTASVRSVGYSDLFVLSKKDMWDVLKEYPAARVRLEAIAVKRLEKYKRAPLERDTFWGSGADSVRAGSGALGDGVALLPPATAAATVAAIPSRCLPAPSARSLAAALGRSQSAPGLVESRGRVPLEEMWVSPLEPLPSAPGAPPPYAAASRASLYSPGVSPPLRRIGASPQSAVSSHSSDEERRAHPTRPYAQPFAQPFAPSFAQPPLRAGARSSASIARGYGACEGLGATAGRVDAAAPRETTPLVAAQPHGGPPVTSPQPSAGDVAHLAAADGVALEAARLLSHDALLAEVKRLRERLAVLEAENAAMSVKLSQQQWEVETRLAEIEMHICGASSGASSATEDNERNRESII